MLKFIVVTMVVIVSVSCVAPVNRSSATIVPAAAPTSDALLALETRANEAYIKGEANFFGDFLSDKVVMTNGGHRMSKADFVKMVSEIKCNIKEGWSLAEPQIQKLNDDAYILSYKLSMDGTCIHNGKTEKQPSPVRASTLWVRIGEKWQAAFHGENRIVAPKDLSSTGTMPQPDPAATLPDPATDALMAAEKSIWEVWKAKDGKKIANLTANEITFVNIFGTYFANKAEAIKDWTGATCDVKSFSLTNGIGTFVTPTVGILTLTGTVDGDCGGQKPPPVYGTTVYVKDGGVWKWAFGFNSPD